MPVTGSHTDIAPAVSPWYPPRTVSSSRRSGMPRPCQACSAIFTATSTATLPESLKNTRRSGSGVMRTSVSASPTAGSCVSPPNMTCEKRSTWACSAASSTGCR
jgi:hypothetical protein